MEVLEETPRPKKMKNPILEMGHKYYIKYFLYSSKWKIFLVIALFLLTKTLFIAFLRILSFYEDQKNGNFLPKESQYWSLLGGIQVVYLLSIYLELFVLNLTLLSNNKKIHEKMIESLMRCKPSVLDTTNSGELSNYFSNDIGILDSTFFFAFQETFTYISFSILALINTTQIEPLTAIVYGVIIIAFLVVYCVSKKYILISQSE